MENLRLILEQTDIDAYLAHTDIIDVQDQAVQTLITDIRSHADSDLDRARTAFEYARDRIRHSFDVDGEAVTIRASAVLAQQEGICFAKAHVLAALLRGLGIAAAGDLHR